MKLYLGYIINPSETGGVDYYPDGALVVSPEKQIVYSGDASRAFEEFPSAQIIDCDGKAILPGFVDLHSHIPQLPVIGTARGTLLEWLADYVFPVETKFSDPELARSICRQFFEEAHRRGTRTMALYSSSNLQSTEIAFEEAERIGMRAYIGLCLMDMNAPAELLKSAEDNIKDLLLISNAWHGKGNGRLKSIVTPRFALSCSRELLKRCGEVAASEGLFIQTHLSENLNEIDAVKTMYPDAPDYTSVYRQFGLLTDKTLLAHTIHLSEPERDALRDSGAVAVHCPLSNKYLRSGIMPLSDMLNGDIRLSLGSDVAAGHSLSMLSVAREAVESSKMLDFSNGNPNEKLVDVETAFRLATIEGARALGIEGETGNLDAGKKADFIIVDCPRLSIDLPTTGEDVLASVMYRDL